MHAFSKACRHLFTLILSTVLISCASVDEDSIEPWVSRLKEPFVHDDVSISGWESPPFRDGKPLPQARLLVAASQTAKPKWVRLSQGRSYRGLTLSQVDVRGDTIGNPGQRMAAVITVDLSLRLEPPPPKPYLILRDVSGYPLAFYSDLPHPPLR